MLLVSVFIRYLVCRNLVLRYNNECDKLHASSQVSAMRENTTVWGYTWIGAARLSVRTSLFYLIFVWSYLRYWMCGHPSLRNVGVEFLHRCMRSDWRVFFPTKQGSPFLIKILKICVRSMEKEWQISFIVIYRSSYISSLIRIFHNCVLKHLKTSEAP